VPPAFELEINFGGWLPCEGFCFLPFHALHLIEKETLSCTKKRGRKGVGGRRRESKLKPCVNIPGLK
jgi:hypothetical protein